MAAAAAATTGAATAHIKSIASGFTVPEGKFKLYYFNANGRGFASRVALSAAGFDYEDVRVDFKELVKMRTDKDGVQYNQKVPLGSLPILEFPDGSTLSQSAAIARYAGKFSGLYPTDPVKAFIVDEVVDTCADIYSSAPQDPDKEKKKQLREAYAKEKLPKYFSLIDRRIKQSGGPLILGKEDQLSIADLIAFSVIESIKSGGFDYVPAEVLDPWKETLGVLFNTVQTHPIVVKSGAIHSKKD